MQPGPDVEMPEGVELRDFGDFDKARQDIYERTKKSMIDAYPMSFGGVRMELADVDYEGPEDFSLEEQKKALLEDRYLSRRLRGTVKLFDEETGKQLDENRLSLMRVPYLTRRGTIIHGGNEYTSIMQSRLLPGVYTRRQDNGALETQFNLRQARAGFRVGFEPETTQYRLKIGQANMHMYSLLKDLGVPEERLRKMWGDDIFGANAAKYDARVFEKAYERLVPARERNSEASREEKVEAIKKALDAAEVHAGVVRKNLPNRFNMEKSAEWQARWAGRQAMIEKIASRADTSHFKPDLSPNECFNAFTDYVLCKSAGEEWAIFDDAGEDPDFVPDLKPKELKEQYANLYGRVGSRLAGMQAWPKEWMPPGSNPLGWLDWYYGYMDGRRTGDDARQIKRWKSFKARHLPQFLKNPTARHGFALRNWAIDPLLYLDEEAQEALKQQMDEYRQKTLQKAAADDTAHLQQLLQAKEHSDAKRYGHKHYLIQRSMMDRPDEWVVDTPNLHHPGVTHVPTGFRVHMDSSRIPPTIKVDTTHALSKSDIPENTNQTEKLAAFDAAELQGLAQFLNKEHAAGLPLNVSQPQLEQAILDFLEGDGVDAGMLEIGIEGAEQARSDIDKLNTQETPQPGVFESAVKFANESDEGDVFEKSANMALRKLIRMWKRTGGVVDKLEDFVDLGGHRANPQLKNLLRYIIKKNPDRPLTLDTPAVGKWVNGNNNFPIAPSPRVTGQYAALKETVNPGLLEGDRRLLRPSVISENFDSADALNKFLSGLDKQASIQPTTFEEMFNKQASELEELRSRISKATKYVAEPKSKAQANAGNYKKGHFAWKGLNITIENPKGSVRKGKGKNDWQRTMRCDYGYIKRTESSADGDHIDVFFGSDPDSEVVFIVDQCNPHKESRPFDEHKCMCGFKTKTEAKKAYLANYEDGWQGFLGITTLTLDQFKWWILEGDTGKPLCKQKWHIPSES